MGGSSDIGCAATLGACPPLADLEGARTAAVDAHVRSCAGCRLVSELLDLRREDAPQLCERVEDLIALRETGAITRDARAIIDAHVATCDPCRAVAATAHSISANVERDLRSLPLVSPELYLLGRELARGGMGRILEARDLRVGRPVAVKELLGATSSLAARFEREARVTARLQHPGIVPIYEIGAWPDGTPFYSMRLIEGTTLGATLANAKTLEERLALLPSIISAAEAVAFAHSHDVIHRDLTPANIMLGAFGETVVIDWGLAKDLSESCDEDVDVGPYRAPPAEGDLTVAGAVIGTAAYMSPEQAAGEAVDPRSDVYALGALLYQMLAGRAPFRGKSSAEVLEHLRAGPPPPVSSLASGAPTDLVSIVDKAMAREREDRYPSAKELVDELRRFQTGRIVEAHAYSRRELASRWLRRHRALVIGTVVLAVALVGTGVLWYRAVASERAVAITERDRAAAEARRTKDRNIALLEEQGRQYLLAGDELRALAYLDEAMQQGLDTPALRLMIGMAMQVVDRPRAELECASFGHFGGTLSPDGKRVALACEEQLRVFDTRSRQVVFELAIPGLASRPVFSEDSRFIAIGGDATVIVDVQSGSVRRRVEHPHIVMPIGFHGDAAVFASERSLVVVPGDVPVREIAVARTATEWQNYHGNVRDGLALIGRGVDQETFDLASGRVLVKLPLANRALVTSELASNATLLTCTEGRATIYDARTGATLRTIVVGDGAERPVSCQLDRDGRRLLVALESGRIELFELATGKRLHAFAVTSGVRDARFLETHHAIGIDRANVELEIRSQESGQQLARFQIRGPVLDLSDDAVLTRGANGVDYIPLAIEGHAFEPPSGYVAIGSDGSGSRLLTRAPDQTYAIWNTQSGARVIEFVAAIPPRFADDRTHVTAAIAKDTVAAFDSRDGKVLGRVTFAGATNLGCDRTCTRAFATDGIRTVVWDVASGAQLVELRGDARGNALSPDGRRVAVRPLNTSVQVWDVDARVELVSIVNVLGTTLGFDHASRYLLVHDGGGIEAFDIATKQSVLATTSVFAARDEAMRFVASFGNGRVATYAFDQLGSRHLQAVHLAEVTSPQHAKYALTPTPSSDGRFLISKSLDTLVEIRDAATGRILLKLGEAHPNAALPQWHGQDTVIGFGRGIARWKLQHDTRTAAEVHAFTTTRVPWHFVDGKLVAVAGTIRGRVLRDGKPAGSIRIRGRLLPSGSHFVGWSEADGDFLVRDIPEGDVLLVANTDEQSSPQVLARRDRAIDLHLRTPVTASLAPVTDAKSLASRFGSRQQSMLTFVNKRATEIVVHWIDQVGIVRSHHRISAGEIGSEETYRGHVFLVRDADGTDLGVAVGAMVPQRIEVR